MNPAADSLCQYRHISNDLHEFLFHDNSRDAIKAWANHVEQLQLKRAWYGKSLVRLLLDARKTPDLSLRFLFEMLSDYNRPYPQLVPPQVRIAYLHNSDTKILSVYYQFAELMKQPTSIEFFKDKDAALSWLKQQ